jgi:hypothetical protein
MTEIINAFHPKYIETYHPELIKEGRAYSSQVTAGSSAGQKSRVTRESVKGRTVNTINVFPKTKAKT